MDLRSELAGLCIRRICRNSVPDQLAPRQQVICGTVETLESQSKHFISFRRLQGVHLNREKVGSASLIKSALHLCLDNAQSGLLEDPAEAVI